MPPRAPPGPRPPPRAPAAGGDEDTDTDTGGAGGPGLRPLAPRPWRWLLLLALPAACSAPPPPRPVYTNHWAVQVLGGPAAADRVAAAHGYLNLGQIGNLEDYYHFYHSKTFKRSALSSRGPHTFLRMDPQVKWLQQQEVKRRVKRQVRSDPQALYFNDPIWSNMWYMHCGDKNSRCRSEMNVQAAWKRGYTGKNVVVTILDDGIERNHPDLAPNYDSYASYDVNGNDYDPSPRYDASNENKHGTRCAGEVAASANNSYCIVGIAYNAKIGGIRMLDGDVTDVVEAKSLGIRPNYIDIYSASWGPDDDGKTVDGPGRLARQAFEYGIKKGRQGLGSIFVWASGNGGREGDHCSCDGYTNSIYTISVSSTTENGYKPWYLEECASTLATTYSSGAFYERKIVTTDLRQRCTDGHTGTSVSAPMVAGIIALALEANSQLTWRDVQHLLVKTSRPAHLKANDWKVNGAGHKVSHLYGFGLVDADALVMEAKKWTAVPLQHSCVAVTDKRPRSIPVVQTLRTSALTTACADHSDQRVGYLEHVVARITISHPRRGDLQIHLISPSGTKSQLLAKRLLDHSNEGFTNWEFMTVHCWGEKAEGEWTLEIQDMPSQVRNPEKQDQKNCLKCHPSCKKCMDEPEKCTVCKEGFSLARGSCIPDCEPGTYFDSELIRCGECHPTCQTCVGPSREECIHCAPNFHFQDWKCVPACGEGFYPEEMPGLPHKVCRRCDESCLSCEGSSRNCSRCKTGFTQLGTSCITNHTCSNGARSFRGISGHPGQVGEGFEEVSAMSSHTLLAGSILLANSQREQNEFQGSTAPASEQLLGP
ncbi:proprotein convertase subtilisin/kexin type 6 isoform X6 [Physeter macrocephalus]|uniref:Proprotein convertase subtilisin/kexin type 6 isoform X6 n=1 Tax=Physeter macrocephalus TaxID=9755 RepID=A0A9W2WXG0_PHYMC|nr:proprotein convertase subtilisin/kexin type 6 isoform X6 [Physeter catodon]